jgi:AraC-like DNA-binding protein
MAGHQVMENASSIRIWRPGGLEGVELFRSSRTRYCFPKHFHDTYSIRLLEAGAVESLYLGRRNVLTAGDIDVLEPGIVHTASAAGEEGWSCRCLYISTKFLEYSALEFGATRLPPLESLLERNERPLFLRFQWAHYHLEADSDELEGETLLTGALAALVARFAGRPHKVIQAGHEPRHVATIRNFLDEHYGRQASLADLARMVELNPVYLVRCFRRHIGLPPHAYRRQVRLNQACRMLRLGVRASEVACAVGFADQSHLTRVFKHVMGVTPAQYAAGS